MSCSTHSSYKRDTGKMYTPTCKRHVQVPKPNAFQRTQPILHNPVGMPGCRRAERLVKRLDGIIHHPNEIKITCLMEALRGMFTAGK